MIGLGRVLPCIGLGVLGLTHLFAAPVDLSAPSTALGAADAQGNVEVWREIEEVDFGDGLKFPLRIGFSSARQSSSPYIGSGWTCPLVEAKAFLKREKMMQVMLPCGKTMFLRRDREVPNKFQTLDREWTGILDADAITVSRKDGWELRYQKGLLTQIRSDSGRLLNWTYAGSIVTEIREQGKATSPFQLDLSSNGVVNGFIVNGKRHAIELGKRPIIKNESGINVVTDLKPSISSWTWPDKTKEIYNFEPTSTLIPSLKIADRKNAGSTFSWDPTTNNITSEDEWVYKVGPVKNLFDLPKLSRVNSKKQEEFSMTDLKSGIREQKTLKQGHRVTQLFSSPGKLYGKVRKIEQVDDKGSRTRILEVNYDDQGRLYRKIDAKGFSTIWNYAPNGKLTGKSILAPADPKILSLLKAKEVLLLADIDNAVNGYDREGKIQALGFFYIHDLGDPSKALALLPLIPSRLKRFNLQFHAINGNLKTTESEKIDQLQNLLKEYPDKSNVITVLVNDKMHEMNRN